MKDASYLRLKNLELGYNIPDCLCQKFAIQRMRVYFTGLNLLTFTQVRNWDAEKFAGDTENFNYPQLKSYSIGLNITFNNTRHENEHTFYFCHIFICHKLL